MEDRFYFTQLTSGEDFGVDNPFARQMANHCYSIGDRRTGEAVLVDPTYDVSGILEQVRSDGFEPTSVILTHYHADHAGGSIAGHEIEGTVTLLEEVDIPVHVHRDEVEFVTLATGLQASQLVTHDSGDTVNVGEYDVELIHTPGHTPGSQCLLVEDHLLSGDTLFLSGCGRTDLPGGDAAELYVSLTQRLSQVGDNIELFPGHHYSDDLSASMGNTRQSNNVFRPKSKDDWLRIFAS